MHIGIHVNTLPTTVFINRLIEGLVKNGYRVTVIGTALKAFKKIDGAHYVFFRLHSFLNHSKILFFINYNFRLLLLKNAQKKRLDSQLAASGDLNTHNKTRYYPLLLHAPEVLHVQWVKGIEQFLWVQEFGMKLVASLRGTNIYMNPILDPVVNAGYRRAFPLLDGFHAVCYDLVLTAETYGLNPKTAKVCYSGLNLAEFPFSASTHTERKSTLKIISVGRQSWMKGYQHALDAMRILKNKELRFTYTILGGGDSEELLFQVADLNLKREVELISWVALEEVKSRITQADIVLIPSVSEGISNVAIEAMALGTLVITSNCGGMTEIIVHGQTGFVVPVRDPEAIAEAIMKVEEISTEKLETIVLNARKKVEEQHSEDKMIRDFTSLYEQVISGNA